MKSINKIKIVLFIIFYSIVYPLTLIVTKLIPYIKNNDTNIELVSFCLDILKSPLKTTLEIFQSPLNLIFIFLQIVVIIMLIVFLNPTKKEPFQVVGKTIGVHGTSYWREEKDLKAPQNVLLLKEKKLKSIILESMKEGENEK
ncbi:hypothetical protein ACODGV_12205 [Vagococcus fluvialis]|uniref:hypothetical protein n=1 Tax=Vagococcus fluvialis TaxID=2738 RepID=UPI003B219724